MAGLVHSIPTDLSRRLKVIGAGQPRTGTTSFTLALQILLGAPVLHSGSACVAREEEFIKTWIEALDLASNPRGARKEVIHKSLHKVCDGYVGITDAPGVMLVGELVETYPEAIVICTTRDPARWWASFESVSNTIFLMKALNALFILLPTLRYFGAWIDAMTRRSEFLFNVNGIYKMDQGHIARHEDYVRHVTPPGRLFFFNVKDGWGPLCKILDVPVPDVPFPHANDADAVQELLQGFIKRAIIRWVILLGTLGAIFMMVRRSL